MAAHQIQPRPLCRKWQSLLTKLKVKLSACKLLHVLESFPPAPSFAFYEATVLHKKALKVCLGLRSLLDGSQATSWAYVLLERSQFDAPVIFRDEIVATQDHDDQPQLFPRAATSLLRKATDLVSPIRFLQFDPPENGARGMLCALILYYSLANGLAESAIQWSAFEVNLVKALQHIDGNAEYQQWRDERPVRPDTIPKTVATKNSTPEEATGADEHTTNGVYKRGGIVCSIGSQITIKPGTTLAKLKDALGDKFQLVDALPRTPVTFERQALFPDYFPFRLHFGRYREYDVYVYLTFDLRGTSKIIAQNEEGETWSWTFLNLQEIQLFDPFSVIMRLSSRDLSTRGNKIRYLVYYYFMLAENAEMIDNPRIRGSFQSMIPSFCSACRDLERAQPIASNLVHEPQAPCNTGVDPSSDNPYEEDLVSCEKSTVEKRTQVVKLRCRPEALAAFIKARVLNQRTEVSERDNEAERREKCNVVTSQLKELAQEMATITSTEVQEQFKHDSESMPALGGKIMGPVYPPQTDELRLDTRCSHDSGLKSSSSPTESNSATFPVISAREQSINLSTQTGVSIVIDLSSDAEVSIPLKSPNSETEEAPRDEDVWFQRHQQGSEAFDTDDFCQPVRRELKRKANYFISEKEYLVRKTANETSDEDHSYEEVDGDIWRQVLERQSQVKRVQLHA